MLHSALSCVRSPEEVVQTHTEGSLCSSRLSFCPLSQDAGVDLAPPTAAAAGAVGDVAIKAKGASSWPLSEIDTYSASQPCMGRYYIILSEFVISNELILPLSIPTFGFDRTYTQGSRGNRRRNPDTSPTRIVSSRTLSGEQFSTTVRRALRVSPEL